MGDRPTIYSIRLANHPDLAQLQHIEVSAGQLFADIGMPEIADDEPLSIAELASYIDAARGWVAVDDADQPIAYVLVDIIDGCAHIEQLSVHGEHAGQRIGFALIESIAEWASHQCLPALTLTTFRDVPWNAPYYQRCGFQILSDTDITPGLLELRVQEARHGLDAWPRVCMRRSVAV